MGSNITDLYLMRAGVTARVPPGYTGRCTTMPRDFMAEDRGKNVLTADGEMVGTVEDIKGSNAHVKPEASLDQSIRSKLGWTTDGEDVYELRHAAVSEITDDEIHLKQTL